MSLLHRTLSSAAIGIQNPAAELEGLRHKYEQRLFPARDRLNEKIDHAKALKAAIGECNNQSGDIETQALALLAVATHELDTAHQEHQKAQHFKDIFCLEHGLTREPQNPSVISNVMALTLMGFGETALNSAFFANAALTATPISALTTSGLISFTNIVASTCMGYFAGRYLDYGLHTAEPELPEYRLPRKFARIGLGISIAALCGFHVTVGHVRAQEDLHSVSHSLSAYWQLITTPEAIFLVLFGVCLSIIAYHKGKHAFSDQYPQYSAHANAVSNAKEELFEIYENRKEDLEAIFDEEASQASKENKDTKKAVEAYNKAVKACRTAHRSLSKQISETESTVRAATAQLSQMHQGASAKKRSGKAADCSALASFQHLLDVELPEEISLSENTSNAALSEAKSRVLGLLAEHLKNLHIQ